MTTSDQGTPSVGAPAISFDRVGKMYKVFERRADNLLDALGLARVFPSRGARFREFWALRDVTLELGKGERLGIIGRNGAGKSTLLKLITRNLAPTTGTVRVNGDVQALLEIGGGLHPEFTGSENIRAALLHLGLSKAELQAAEREIGEFTELGRFLDQPFKTYSLGMQARLSFAIATTIEPEILIIDEILGAGDAYFFSKSSERMRHLIDGGASVLIVSHALDQIARFCDETLWLDRGRVVMYGRTTEVVKAYEKFIRGLDEQRLQARNRKAALAGIDGFERDGYLDHLWARVTAGSSAGSRVDVRRITLLRDRQAEGEIFVGDAQDSSAMHPCYILLDGNGWSRPVEDDEEGFHRSIDRPPTEEASSPAAGTAAFNLWFLYPESRYSIEIEYRSTGDAPSLDVGQGDTTLAHADLPTTDGWRRHQIPISTTSRGDEPDLDEAAETTVSRWRGTDGIVIADVHLKGEGGEEQGVFTVGSTLRIDVAIRARERGTFRVIPAALVFRLDGVVVTRHVGEPALLALAEGEEATARLELPSLLLGNGTYLVSLGLYRKLDVADVEESEFYDYLDKSYEFQVVGNPVLHNELVRHPGAWSLVGRDNESPKPLRALEAVVERATSL